MILPPLMYKNSVFRPRSSAYSVSRGARDATLQPHACSAFGCRAALRERRKCLGATTRRTVRRDLRSSRSEGAGRFKGVIQDGNGTIALVKEGSGTTMHDGIDSRQCAE